MRIKPTTRRLATGLLLSLFSSTAYGQVISAPEQGTAPAEDATSAEQSDVVVTGTRIRRPDLTSNSPLTAVGSQEIQYQGATNIESVMNRLPQFTADATENASNGSDGTSNINLRNLGSNRVLVLINGQRMLPQQAVDLNFVPSALVERVDVVTGGASAVYGSDAMSGVVNFILRDNLDGFRFDVQTGFNQHNNDDSYARSIVSERGYQTAPRNVVDGGRQDINGAFGKNFADGRGNITVYGGYRHVEPVLQSSRDYSACAFDKVDEVGSGLACGGSSNTTYGTFAPLTGPNANSDYLTNNADGSKTWVPYSSAQYAYNYSPTNYIQRSDERITAGGFAKYRLVDAAEVYGSFMYMRDRTYSQVAPSALFLGTAFAIPCNNPLMSTEQAAALCGADAGSDTAAETLIGYRLNNDFSRRDYLRHDDYRYTAGVRGDIGRGFSYDLSYLHSLVRYNETYMNNVDNVKAQRALDVVDVNGVATCRSAIDGTDPDCVPVDVFQANGITSEQASYLFSESNTASRNTQTVFSANLAGDLGTFGLRSPWAERGINIALGAEHRRETLRTTADEVAEQGGATDSDGKISVTEGFGELEVPILQNLPLVHELTLNGGLRYSAYHNEQGSTGYELKYNAWTYKAELAFTPIQDMRLRASYNHAMRAPNITELFSSQSIGNVSATDPCAGSNPTASYEVCALTGVTQAQYGSIIQCPSNLCSALGGGNRDLKPEKADTYTVGLVLTPRMIPNFSLSVDYYHIKIKHYISSIDASLAISQCLAGDAYYCSLFQRDPRSGAIFGTDGYIISTTYNTGFLQTSGIDVAADYTLRLGSFGKLNANLVGTWLKEQVAEPLPGLGTYDCKGYFGFTCGLPSPEWRHVARLTWLTPGNATLSLSWRFLEHTKLSSFSSDKALTNPTSIYNRRIPDYNYFDLAGTVAVADGLQLRAGINNLTDRSPPIITEDIASSFSNGNTYPGMYDLLGRTVFIGATITF